MVAGCQKGWVKPVIGQRFPLAEAAKAHEEVIAHTAGAAGRIVLDV